MGWKSWAGAGLGAGGGFLIGGPAGAMAGGAAGYSLGAGLEGSMDRNARASSEYGGVGPMNVPHFQEQYDQYGRLADQYGKQGSAFRKDQAALGHTLSEEAQGRGIGQMLVTDQARQAADRASAQQFGAIAGARPGMQAMASRNAMLGSALAQSAVGEQASNASGQVTLGAQNLYSNHLAGARGQDINQQQANSSAQLGALGQRGQLSQAQQQGAMTAEQIRAQRYQALLGAPTNGEIIAGGLSGMGAAAMGMKSPFGGGGGSAPGVGSSTGSLNTSWDPGRGFGFGSTPLQQPFSTPAPQPTYGQTPSFGVSPLERPKYPR